ncbi:MAG TPA: ROK family protein, partial [Acidimicrobiales bacterium]|nr:ROK family protein [Acidimicrobiales bacterium]
MRIGIDLGGTKIYGLAVDEGVEMAEVKAKTPVHGGPMAVIDAIVAMVQELGRGAQVEAVGVGAPGAVDYKRGIVGRAPNLKGWLDPFPLAAALTDALGGVPVAVDNDVNVGTVAEHRLGAGRQKRDFMGVFVGTGVGAGLILNGRLRRGPTGFAGEIGHMVVRSGGRVCGCGARGHLEAYAGRAGMERRARQFEQRGRDTLLVDVAGTRRMTSSVFAQALDKKDAIAIRLVDRAVATLGIAVAAAVVTLDIPLVVMGGGLADRLGSPFIDRVAEATHQALPPGSQPELKVVPAQLGDRGGAHGAVLLADEHLAKVEAARQRREQKAASPNGSRGRRAPTSAG